MRYLFMKKSTANIVELESIAVTRPIVYFVREQPTNRYATFFCILNT